MKKIRLNVASMNATEILSREQLKTIFGGSTVDCDPIPIRDENGNILSGVCNAKALLGFSCTYYRYNPYKYSASGGCVLEEHFGTCRIIPYTDPEEYKMECVSQ